MAEEKRAIFRERSLSKLSSPDRLDQLLRIVRPHSWVMIVSIAVGLGLAIAWSILGTIPETVRGPALLARPKQIIAFQSPGSGQISAIEVQVGDRVAAGDLLARISLPTLEKELEEERAKLDRQLSRTGEMKELERKLAEQELERIADLRDLTEKRIIAVEATSTTRFDKTKRYTAGQQANIDTAREKTRALSDRLEENFKVYSQLKEDGLTNRDKLLQVQTSLVENELTLANLDVREQALRLQEVNAEKDRDDALDKVDELRIELASLKLDEVRILKKLRQDELDGETAIEDTQQRIATLETQLQSRGFLHAEAAGEIHEISVSVGAQVGIGQRLGRMEIEDADAELRAIAFLAIKDGKKVQDGLRIRVSPVTVEKERFGGIVGNVIDVSDYPMTTEAAGNLIGDSEIARTLMAGQSRIKVEAALHPDETFTGYRWTSGAGPSDLPITAGTTAEVSVTIRERAPITLLLPFLESLRDN